MNSDSPKHLVEAAIDPANLRQFADISETLLNLIYLTQLEADRPEQVRKYMDLSESSMKAMIAVLHNQAPFITPN